MAKATICDRDKRIAPEKPYKLSVKLEDPDGNVMVEVKDAELCEPCALGFVSTFDSRIKIDASDPSVFVHNAPAKPVPVTRTASPEPAKAAGKKAE